MKSKKEQILDVSLSLFLEKGYDNTSISDILSNLNIARGTLYYHFESKEAIMDEIIERSIKSVIEEAKGIVFRQGMTVQEKMFTLFSSTSMRRLSGRELMIDYLNQPQNALLHEKINRSFIQKIVPILGDIIKEGVEEGTFINAYPYESAEMILVIIIGFMDVYYEKMDENDIKHRTESLLYNMERILGVKEGSFDMFKSLSLYEERGEENE
ncbi:transcriptional regulator, TetR family [Catonella morbi ATCC 51271]|uniref:Transcriptional regulator, TetR family n=1 Tax=Catonella morbi ATCC 51271 TaxID=592026 RepID=V2XHL2_9FIRM|nr:TetR/AcrR family transcriptional regulator [Catonella morbi]ESL01629.1 transcriptional regulator, TetR family [Catonella morbi ATCC 51271]